MAFVQDGLMACCDRAVFVQPNSVKRMTMPEERRKGPSKHARRTKLAAQENKCLYCSRTFGSFVEVKGAVFKLRVAWDHMLPFAYSLNNVDANFAAACHVCNGWKSDHIFQTLEEAQAYLLERWSRE